MDFNINELKTKIDTRKAEKIAESAAVGKVTQVVNRGNGMGRAILSDLVTSLNGGGSNNTTEVMKTVSKIVDGGAIGNNGGVGHQYVAPRAHRAVINENYEMSAGFGGNVDRDAMFEEQFQRRSSEGINRAISMYYGGGGQQPTQYPQQPVQYAPQAQPQPMNINPNFLNEQVARTINEQLNSNLQVLVEGAFKNVLSDIFSSEKINKTIDEYVSSNKFKNAVNEAIKKIYQEKQSTKK